MKPFILLYAQWSIHFAMIIDEVLSYKKVCQLIKKTWSIITQTKRERSSIIRCSLIEIRGGRREAQASPGDFAKLIYSIGTHQQRVDPSNSRDHQLLFRSLHVTFWFFRKGKSPCIIVKINHIWVTMDMTLFPEYRKYLLFSVKNTIQMNTLFPYALHHIWEILRYWRSCYKLIDQIIAHCIAKKVASGQENQFIQCSFFNGNKFELYHCRYWGLMHVQLSESSFPHVEQISELHYIMERRPHPPDSWKRHHNEGRNCLEKAYSYKQMRLAEST